MLCIFILITYFEKKLVYRTLWFFSKKNWHLITHPLIFLPKLNAYFFIRLRGDWEHRKGASVVSRQRSSGWATLRNLPLTQLQRFTTRYHIDVYNDSL